MEQLFLSSPRGVFESLIYLLLFFLWIESDYPRVFSTFPSPRGGGNLFCHPVGGGPRPVYLCFNTDFDDKSYVKIFPYDSGKLTPENFVGSLKKMNMKLRDCGGDAHILFVTSFSFQNSQIIYQVLYFLFLDEDRQISIIYFGSSIIIFIRYFEVVVNEQFYFFYTFYLNHSF